MIYIFVSSIKTLKCVLYSVSFYCRCVFICVVLWKLSVWGCGSRHRASLYVLCVYLRVLDDTGSSAVWRWFCVCQRERVSSGYGAAGDAMLLMIQNTDLCVCVYFGLRVFRWERLTNLNLPTVRVWPGWLHFYRTTSDLILRSLQTHDWALEQTDGVALRENACTHKTNILACFDLSEEKDLLCGFYFSHFHYSYDVTWHVSESWP